METPHVKEGKDSLDPAQIAKLEWSERAKHRHLNKQILEHLKTSIITNHVYNSTPSPKDHLLLPSFEQTKHPTLLELKKEINQEEEVEEKIVYIKLDVDTALVTYLPTIYGNL